MKDTDHPTAAYLLGFGLGLVVAAASWLAADAERRQLAELGAVGVAAWVPATSGDPAADAARDAAKAALEDAGVAFAEGGAAPNGVRLFKGEG